MRYTKINILFFIFVFGILSLVLNRSVFSQTQYDIAVTATVPPQQTDFQFDFSSSDGQSTVNQNTTLSYKITYGAKSTAGVNTNTTIVADFSNDLSPDNSHVLDYVIGSATSAYGGASPVVDLNNRTITWTIPNLPSGTINQTVTFQLKTNTNYTGSSNVTFTTRATMRNQYQTLPDKTITQTYKFNPAIDNPPSTVNIPPSKGPLPTSTPIPQPNNLKITDISLTDISDHSAAVSVSTSLPARLTLKYGTDPINLSQKVKTDTYLFTSTLNLESLLPGTIYYFRITAVDKNSKTAASDIFTFRTAKKSRQLILKNAAASIITNGTTIFSRIIGNNFTPGFVILTDNTDYEFNYSPPDNISLNSLDLLVKEKNQGLSQTSLTVNAFQKKPQFFTAYSRTHSPNSYEVFVKEQDSDGNLVQVKIADLKVIPRLSVLQEDTNQPIGDARVFIYYLNEKTGKYLPLTAQMHGNNKNPQFTNKIGEINLLLPEGKYKAETSSFWYKSISTEFILGPKNGEEFPVVHLKRDPYNILSLVYNLKNLLIDSYENLLTATHSLSVSIRLFNTMAGLTLLFSGISILFFLLKTHIKFRHLPVFFMFHLHMLASLHKPKYLYGIVTDVAQKPITKALVELIDTDTNNILTHTITNKSGRFQVKNTYSKKSYKILVQKDGFSPIGFTLNDTDLLSNGLNITLKVGDSKSQQIFGIKLIEHVGGSLFESALLISIILEIVFLSLFGFMKTLPFFVLSLCSIMLWIFYLKEHNGYK